MLGNGICELWIRVAHFQLRSWIRLAAMTGPAHGLAISIKIARSSSTWGPTWPPYFWAVGSLDCWILQSTKWPSYGRPNAQTLDASLHVARLVPAGSLQAQKHGPKITQLGSCFTVRWVWLDQVICRWSCAAKLFPLSRARHEIDPCIEPNHLCMGALGLFGKADHRVHTIE